MSEEIEYPRDFADRIYRESLKKPENLRDLVSVVLPEIAGGFVFERAELVDREFPLDDWRRRESDLLFRVPFRDGDTELETLICLLLEHQSKPDLRIRDCAPKKPSRDRQGVWFQALTTPSRSGLG